MYLVLFDPIFWINRTLATFDRMVEKLQKYINKCESEMLANKDAVGRLDTQTKARVQERYKVRDRKVTKINEKAAKDASKITDKSATAIVNLNQRTQALERAKQRAETTAKNIKKITGDE